MTVEIDNDSTESHVDRGGKEWRCNQNKHGLNDVWTKSFGVEV